MTPRSSSRRQHGATIVCTNPMPAVSVSTEPSPPAPVTIRDVARAAGVHLSTVSRALDPAKRHLVRAEVLRDIEATARRLGYRPNRAASTLRTGRSFTVGVLVPDMTNPVFPPILQGIEACAAARGYFVLVAHVPDATLARAGAERMIAQRVDGSVMANARRDEPLVAVLQASGTPTIRVNRAGARTTVDGIHRRHANEGHLCARGKRQDAVLILHQHNAFALDLANLRVAGGFQFGQRAVLAVIVADVALFGHAVRELGNDFGAARAEEGVELHFALVGDDTARDNQRRQARRDIQEHFFQRPMLGGRFHKNRVLLSNDVYSDTRKNALC